jgi:hypothetical protein
MQKYCAICGYVDSEHMHGLPSLHHVNLVSKHQTPLKKRRRDVEGLFSDHDRLCCCHFAPGHPARFASFASFEASFLHNSGRRSISPSKRKLPAPRLEDLQPVEGDDLDGLGKAALAAMVRALRLQMEESAQKLATMEAEANLDARESMKNEESWTKLPTFIVEESLVSLNSTLWETSTLDSHTRHQWIVSFFIYYGRVLPQVLISERMRCSQSLVSKMFSKMIPYLEQYWYRHVSFNDADQIANVKIWEDKFLDVCPTLNGKLVFVIDGSGTRIYNPSHNDLANANFCNWKEAEQIRWFVVCDVQGRIQYVSPVYPGKESDKKSLDRDLDLRTRLDIAYGDCSKVLFLGDKGYPHCERIFNSKFGITKSGQDSTPQRDFVYFSAEFSQPRSVVERVIGKLKILSDFVAGAPVTLQVGPQIEQAIKMYAGIVNRILQESPEMFVNLPSPQTS